MNSEVDTLELKRVHQSADGLNHHHLFELLGTRFSLLIAHTEGSIPPDALPPVMRQEGSTHLTQQEEGKARELATNALHLAIPTYQLLAKGIVT